ncbi:MAG: HepT-like ribonuclease domain-containing protein [Jatrophihabitantaceae bacterium]
MSRHVRERFADIIAAIERCRRYREHLDDQDESIVAMAYDAILRNLAVIGEAVRSLPDEVKSAEPNTPWMSIAGLRNIVIHEYFRVDGSLIEEIVRDELEPLANAIAELIATADDEPDDRSD